MTELRCMSFTATPNLLIVAGCQSTFYTIDVEKGCILSTHPAQGNYTLMKRCRYICAATDDGSIHIIDPSTYNVRRTWKAHPGRISDMDARHDYLVTCGHSIRQMGTMMVDPLANVYDLKSLKPLPPIPFHAGAARVRLHPKLTSTAFIASTSGQMQVVDLLNPVNIMLRQLSVQFLVSMEVASSGDALVINDVNGWLYLWGSPAKIRFNNASRETEFGQPAPRNSTSIDWQDQPLNTLGMPYYNERLLSAWPSHILFDVGAPPIQQDPNLTAYLQPAELGVYGAYVNPLKLRRNQVQDTRLDPPKAQRGWPSLPAPPRASTTRGRHPHPGRCSPPGRAGPAGNRGRTNDSASAAYTHGTPTSAPTGGSSAERAPRASR